MTALKWVLVCAACAFAMNVGLFIAGMIIGYFKYANNHVRQDPGVRIVYCGGAGLPSCAALSASTPAAAAPAPSPSL